MAEMKDMYKLARYIDSDKYSPNRKEFRVPHEAIYDCVRSYATERGISRKKAMIVMDNAIDHEYIEVIGDGPKGHILRVATGKGRQLVSKKWFFYRCGLAEQTMQKYPETKSTYRAILIAIVGIVGTILGSVVTVLAQVLFGGK